MKLSQFNFNLKPEQIASEPTFFRDECRMMVLHKDTGEVEHRVFKDFINYCDEGDVVVLNDTKVFPARLYGNKEKTGAEIEVFLLRELNRDQRLWDVLVDPARKIRIGNKLYFGENDALVAEVIDNTTSRGRTLRFLFDGTYEEFKETLYKMGELPIPKWVKPKVEESDYENYQTIYASKEGAVACPAAGPDADSLRGPLALSRIKERGAEIHAQITDDEHTGHKQDIGLNDGEIPVEDSRDAQPPQTRPGKDIFHHKTLSKIADRHGKTTAQVILRWNLQRNIAVIPGSSNPAHIRENSEIFDFALSAEEMERMARLDRGEKHDWY